MAKIYVDNREFEVDDSQNLLHQLITLGFNVPYFCWHPALGSVGACRQCAVKQFRDEKDTRGKLVMACMTPAKEGTRISIEDPEARAFRASIIEWLMENHPHDCPVCDEGGECHLQDMTVMTGHDYRYYRATKRTFRNQYLGPFVNHEMNRCIQCYRCVRYYRDYADGRDLNAFGIRNVVYFGRAQGGVLESEFSGNLVEVCPTGVFTDATLKHHYTRKWDLRTAPSICIHCAVGCNTIPGERYGVLRRINTRYNGQVNGYFLCDRGRFGYEFVNCDRRVRQVMIMDGAARGTKSASVEMMIEPTNQFTADAAGIAHPSFRDNPVQGMRARAAMMARGEAAAKVGQLAAQSKKIIGIGSPRASLESNFALRAFVGADNFYQGISQLQARLIDLIRDILQSGPARTPSLAEAAESDAVLILGEDVTNVAPMLALMLRQASRRAPIQRETAQLRVPDWDDKAVREAIQAERGPFYIAVPNATRLDDVATQVHYAAPDDIARFGQAVARTIGADVGAVSDLPGNVKGLVKAVSDALRSAKRPLIVAGPSLLSAAIIKSAANIASGLAAAGVDVRLTFTMPEANSFGLSLLGGKTLDDLPQAFQKGPPDALFILENDLYRRAPTRSIDYILDSIKHVIVLDHLLTSTGTKAEVILPAATFAEGDGTLVNNEGRAQRYYQVFSPLGEIEESWRWLYNVAAAMGKGNLLPWSTPDELLAAIAEQFPVLKPVTDIAPPSGFRIAGMKIAREAARNSGRTALLAHLTVHEPKPPEDPDTPLSFSMEGFHGELPPALIPTFRAPGWNSIQAVNRFQEEVAGPLRGGDPGKRLLEPVQGAFKYFDDTPKAFEPSAQFLVVPEYHIFGSEELSVMSPGIAELAPQPYVSVSTADAERLGLSAGEQVVVSLLGEESTLPVRVSSVLPKGLVGVPSGLPTSGFVQFSSFAHLRKVQG